jgi:hypothetical protein
VLEAFVEETRTAPAAGDTICKAVVRDFRNLGYCAGEGTNFAAVRLCSIMVGVVKGKVKTVKVK